MRITFLIGLLLVVGCAAPSNQSEPLSGPSGGGITLTVENLNWSDVTVYRVVPAPRKRLMGPVATFRRQSVRVPRSPTDTYAFEVDLIAGPSWTSPELYVRPGGEVEISIPNMLSTSSATPIALR